GDQVRQIRASHAAALVDYANDQHEVGLILGDAYTLTLNLFRQQWRGKLQLVLYLNLRNIRIGALVERHDDAHAAVGIAFGCHVAQSVYAIELLLNDLYDGVLHRLGGRAGVGDGNRHGGRRDVR